MTCFKILSYLLLLLSCLLVSCSDSKPNRLVSVDIQGVWNFGVEAKCEHEHGASFLEIKTNSIELFTIGLETKVPILKNLHTFDRFGLTVIEGTGVGYKNITKVYKDHGNKLEIKGVLFKDAIIPLELFSANQIINDANLQKIKQGNYFYCGKIEDFKNN